MHTGCTEQYSLNLLQIYNLYNVQVPSKGARKIIPPLPPPFVNTLEHTKLESEHLRLFV